MRPDDRDLDDEIRGHLALSIKERVERGEDHESARRAALRDLGYVPEVREAMRRVWYSRWFDAAAALVREMRVGVRSLLRTKGLAATVVVTLALGIGANAATFSVVRGVLLRPLVNRDESRLIYIRQSAPGLSAENTTFSVAEIKELKSRSKTVGGFGDFSTADLTVSGIGPDPQLVRAGVVNGSFFEVMGLRPVLGRLIEPRDDGKAAAVVAVLTYRYWATTFHGDPSVVGRKLRLGYRTATIIGVLEPSDPYPVATEIIANMVASPHHSGAAMETVWMHRMTELFGRLAPGATIESARAELSAIHADMVREHTDAYAPTGRFQVSVTRLRDQIAGDARTILWILLAAAVIVFIIACSNVANLIVARSVRREGELAVRAALGASRGALRRTLLAESLVLCLAGAALGVFLARPFVTMFAQYAARFSKRALDVTVDPSVMWVGAGLAMAAAVLLAYVPRLPSSGAQTGLGLAASTIRITPGTNRRLRVFATTQIAFSFVLLVGAGMLVATLVTMQLARTGYDTRQVLVFDLPGPAPGTSRTSKTFHQDVLRRVSELPRVEGVAMGNIVPWRDAGKWGSLVFSVQGYTPAAAEERPHARFRFNTVNFFRVLGIPIVAGRDFTQGDSESGQRVAIVSQNLARRMSSEGDVVNRQITWEMAVSAGPNSKPSTGRIVGVVPDVDDENVAGVPEMVIYLLAGEGDRLFVRASGDPHALAPAVTRAVREVAADQAVENAATLEEVRSQVLSPTRLNMFVLSGFAGIALLIAVVGVAGVLAFSVSARTREFGVRLAIGSSPRALLGGVLMEGALMIGVGIVAGAGCGYLLARVAGNLVEQVQMPGPIPLLGAAVVLGGAGLVASLMPAARASRLDVLHALRSE